jgi:hypothetical protein
MAGLSAAANVVDNPQDIKRIGSANRRRVLCAHPVSNWWIAMLFCLNSVRVF